MIKKLIPHKIKVNLHVLKNSVLDILQGRTFVYAKKNSAQDEFSYFLEIKQKIKVNETTALKTTNLLVAIARIESIQINPRQIFSFWNIIGNPTAKKGFVKSRALINGKLQPSIGGGLCQLSGLIYYLSLQANLKIIERYNHSVDIYNEETRFTPLGSDATVVYGYKDLKIQNNSNYPIKFSFEISDNKILAKIESTIPIKRTSVDFNTYRISDEKIEVTTSKDGHQVDKSIYGNYT